MHPQFTIFFVLLHLKSTINEVNYKKKKLIACKKVYIKNSLIRL
jgi:hypothetical protein